jgi:hypothetical protein
MGTDLQGVPQRASRPPRLPDTQALHSRARGRMPAAPDRGAALSFGTASTAAGGTAAQA